MKKWYKKQIKKSTLKSKKILEEDIENRLEELGIVQEEIIPSIELDLTEDEIEKRKKILTVLKKLEGKNLQKKTPQQSYTERVAYNYFNRIVAVRLMEKRNILSKVLGTNSSLDGSEIFSKSKQEREKIEYSLYFNQIFNEINEEINKIFDTGDENSIISPSEYAFDEILNQLKKIPNKAWEGEEIVGWMFQYFKSKEKSKTFEELQKGNTKINGKNLSAASCTYTPTRIVRYIVDKTLGILWMEMNHDSNIAEFCEFIDSDQEFMKREKKPIEEIKFLDPACGSGQFLLYAFEIFKKMYKEEGYSDKEIPKKILSNNIYGIDIDSRAVQISKLLLYIKAKSENPNYEIKNINLVSTDITFTNDIQRSKFYEKFDFQIRDEIIKEIWSNLENVDEKGSLVNIEKVVREKIEEEMEKSEIKKENEKDKESYTEKQWKIIKEQILEKIVEFKNDKQELQDFSGQLFIDEMERSLNLIDYFMSKYDVVATNPPYIKRRILNNSIKEFLYENFHGGHADTFSSFVLRCQNLIKEDGFNGALVFYHALLDSISNQSK